MKMPSIKFEEMGLPEGREEELSEAIRASAKAAAAKLPDLLRQAMDISRETDPIGLLSAAAHYSQMIGAGPNGISTDGPAVKIEQAFVELFQALVLTLPAAEWGFRPVLPVQVQALFDLLPELSQAFTLSRWAHQVPQEDSAATAVQSLQERTRLHTQVVRNWGYFHDVVELSKDLYAPLDHSFREKLGFGPSDIIAIASHIIKAIESRATAHWSALGQVIQGRTAEQIIVRYFKHFPGLQGTPGEILEALPKNPTRENAMAAVLGHTDLRLEEHRTFSVAEITALTQLPPEVVEGVLKALSLTPGALVDGKMEHFFLSNPIWIRPGILKPNGDLFLPMPQLVFSHIHDLLRALSLEVGLEKQVEDRRAEFLEQKTERIFREALPNAHIQTGVKWQLGDTQYETDIVAIIDDTLAIVEAKSHRLTPQGLRGAPDRLKRHIQELVLKPSEQSARLQALVEVARSGDAEAVAILAPFDFDATKIRRIIRLSVMLDSFDVVSSDETDLKAAGWIPKDHILAPAIQVADLPHIVEILNHPVLFLHYISQRAYVQREVHHMGDEIDMLALYLQSFFDLDDLAAKQMMLQISGLSKPIDAFFMNRAEGFKAKKPEPQLAPYIRSLIDQLMRCPSPGWMSASIDLLTAGDARKQTEIAAQVRTLRNRSRRRPDDSQFLDRIIIKSDNPRRTALAFYAYAPELAETRTGAISDISNALVQDGFATTLVFAMPARDMGVLFDDFQHTVP